MTTPRVRRNVSAALTIAIGLVAGACVRTTSQYLDDPLPRVESRSLTIRFDNSARQYVHVYLVGAQREWFLGRVESGAVARLRIPVESFEGDTRHMRLAVVAGEHMTLQAALNPRASITLVQPTSAIVGQTWRFTEGQLTSLRIPR